MLKDEPLLAPDRIGTDGAGPYPPAIAAVRKDGLLPHEPLHYVTKHLQQGIESDHFRVKRPMPRIGGFQSFHTARRTIRGFEAMLWLRKGLCGRPPRVKSAFETELSCRLRVCVRPVRAATWPLAQMGVRLPKLPFRLRAERASLWHGLSPGVVRPTVHALLRLGLSEAALCR